MTVVPFPPRPVPSASAADAYRAKQRAAQESFLEWLKTRPPTEEIVDAIETNHAVMSRLYELQSFLVEHT